MVKQNSLGREGRIFWQGKVDLVTDGGDSMPAGIADSPCGPDVRLEKPGSARARGRGEQVAAGAAGLAPLASNMVFGREVAEIWPGFPPQKVGRPWLAAAERLTTRLIYRFLSGRWTCMTRPFWWEVANDAPRPAPRERYLQRPTFQ